MLSSLSAGTDHWTAVGVKYRPGLRGDGSREDSLDVA